MHSTPEWRYMLSLQVSDHTGQEWLTAFQVPLRQYAITAVPSAAQHAEIMTLSPIVSTVRQHVVVRHDDCEYCVQAVASQGLRHRWLRQCARTCWSVVRSTMLKLCCTQAALYLQGATASFGWPYCKSIQSQRPEVWPHCKGTQSQRPVVWPCCKGTQSQRPVVWPHCKSAHSLRPVVLVDCRKLGKRSWACQHRS